MSDFLTNLAARTLAQPTLRPRTPSRFEPVAADEPAFFASPQRPRLATDRGAAAAPAAVSASEKPDDGARGGRRSTEPAEEQMSPEVVIEPRVERVVERDVQRVVERSENVVHVPVREVERIQEKIPHRFEQQPPQVVTRQNTIRERDVERRERSTRTILDRNTRFAMPQERSDQTERSEPTVHVSIGRVEVRAVSQQQAPQRATARRPAMTIDDYVARRKSKERR